MNDTFLQVQKTDSNSVLDNANVLFNEIVDINGDISYDQITGVITINKNGLYIIDWNISPLSSSQSVSIIFNLMSDAGDDFASNSLDKSGSNRGMAIITIQNAPVNFYLVNGSGGPVFFYNLLDVNADLRVVSLTNNNGCCFPQEQLTHL
jgi:hypothetical protein